MNKKTVFKFKHILRGALRKTMCQEGKKGDQKGMQKGSWLYAFCFLFLKNISCHVRTTARQRERKIRERG